MFKLDQIRFTCDVCLLLSLVYGVAKDGNNAEVAPPPPDGEPISVQVTTAPAPGWVTPCKIVEVYDGDTITIEYTKRRRIRLIDCWAPEITKVSAEEKVLGIKSRDNLKKIAMGKNAILFVPESGDDEGDSTSLGRYLGSVWVDGSNLSEMQVRGGFATKSKKGD